jgi:putative ABC transport system permease protein
LEDEAPASTVAVLGPELAAELFPLAEPVGQTVTVSGRAFTVVGVLKPRPPCLSGGRVEDFDRDLYVPFACGRSLFGKRVSRRTGPSWRVEEVALHQVVLTVPDADQVPVVAALASEVLAGNHHRGDWAIRGPGCR